MPTLTNREVREAYPALAQIAQTPTGSVKADLRIVEVLRALREHFEDMDALRLKLVEQYGQRGEDGKLLQDERGNAIMADQPAFDGQFRELLADTWTHGWPILASGFAKMEPGPAPALLAALGDLLEDDVSEARP